MGINARSTDYCILYTKPLAASIEAACFCDTAGDFGPAERRTRRPQSIRFRHRGQALAAVKGTLDPAGVLDPGVLVVD
jgi:hypothetical protein